MIPEVEVSFVGAILGDPGCATDGLAMVVPEDITTHSLRLIYEAIRTSVEDGLQPDFITVVTTLRRNGRLEDAGGVPFVAELIGAVPTSANLAAYARAITESAQLRRLRDAARNILESSQEPGNVPTQQILEHAAAAVLDLIATNTQDGPRHVSDFSRDAREDLRRRGENRGVTGLRTGIPLLDHVTGGLQPGCVYVVAGRPGQGKSALASNIAVHVAAECQVPTLFVSLEMSGQQLLQRAWAARAGVNLHEGIRSEADEELVRHAAAQVDSAPLWIDDCSQGLSLARLRARVRTLEKTQGLGLVVIDYLQLMAGTKRDRRQEVEEVSRGIKMLARASQVPVILLSQLSRMEKGTVRPPVLSDLRESGAIEQDADSVTLLHVPLKEPEKQQVWPVLAIQAKTRGGPTGRIPLRFDRTITRFFPSDRDEYQRLTTEVA